MARINKVLILIIIGVGIFLLTLISLNEKLFMENGALNQKTNNDFRRGALCAPYDVKTNNMQKNSISALNTNKPTYKILVDVEESKLYLFENGKMFKEYKCSGGKWNTPSPIGTWKITYKAKWGEGFRWKFYGIKRAMGKIWHTWNFKPIFTWMGKFTSDVLGWKTKKLQKYIKSFQ